MSELTDEVIGRYSGTEDRRLYDVMVSAIRHLHGFVEDVRPTHDEWMTAIRFLTDIGHITDDVRQEFILLSDTLGVSTLVETIDYSGAPGATENTVLGPFYVPGSPRREFGASILEDPDEGDRVVVRGAVTDPTGVAVAGATLDVWQNATSGSYAVQQPGIQHPHNLRGLLHTDAAGRYEFRTVRPVPYPIPGDGPVGVLLRACGRDNMRAAHIHLMVGAPGFRTLVTHVFDSASAHLDDDAVFGVRDSLLRTFRPDESGELATVFDVVLTPT